LVATARPEARWLTNVGMKSNLNQLADFGVAHCGIAHGWSIRPATLFACVGLATSVTGAQVVGPGQPQVRVQVQPVIPRGAQAPQNLPTRRIFTDEAVGARESLVRVEELAATDNLTEAARVLQQTLDREGEQVLPNPDDARLFETVRTLSHRLMRGNPALLAKYRDQQGARAQELLDQGDFQDVERSYFMTQAGIEATLRLAQWQMERARFHAARITLAQLDNHPDRTGQAARDAAELLAQVGAYVDPILIKERLERWNKNLPPPPVAIAATVKAPKAATSQSRDMLGPSPSPAWQSLGDQPLQSVALGDIVREIDIGSAMDLENEDPELNDAQQDEARSGPRWAWVVPTLDADTLYINDADSIAAYDANTLAQLWHTIPTRIVVPRRDNDGFWGMQGQRSLEDVAGVVVARGLVVGVLGQAKNGGREGDDRLHALDARTGESRWTVDVSSLDARLEGASVRGTPVVEGDILVVAVRKSAQMRRVTALYLVGLDLATGELRWVRNVGSVGMQPWVASQTRVDATLLDQGVVYRSDDMGLVGAYEATTGRCLWLRLTQPIPETDQNNFGNFANREGDPTFRVHQPVMIDGKLFVVEPGFGSVVHIDPESGRPQGRIDVRATGSPVEYLVQIGTQLALVGRTTVAFVDSTTFAQENVRVGKLLTEAGTTLVPTGRAFATQGSDFDGPSLVLPVDSGVILLDPAQPTRPMRLPIAVTGNMIVAGSTQEPGALLIASPTRLHTYLSWDRAETGLRRRAESSPTDPGPTLTYLELALRMGKFELAPTLADQVLGILRKPAVGVDVSTTRSRLFMLLHATMVRSRLTLLGPLTSDTTSALPSPQANSQAPNGPAPRPNPQDAPGPVPPLRIDPGVATTPPASSLTVDPTASPTSSPTSGRVLEDLALLSQIEQRLSRSAETPVQRVLSLIERAHLRDIEQKPAPAVDALQEILLDETLASTLLPGSSAVMASGDQAIARDAATELLTTLLSRQGSIAYAAFDEEATRLLDQLPAQATARDVERLAGMYPLAEASARAWKRAGEAYFKAGDARNTVHSLRQGVASALRGLQIGRDGAEVTLGELLGRLVPLTTTAGERQPLQRLLLSLAKRSPNMVLSGESATTSSPSEAATTIGLADSQRTLSTLQGTLASQPQIIEGWNQMQSAAPELKGSSRDIVLMNSRKGDKVAAFGISALSGRLEMLWSHGVEMTPAVVRITPEATILFWPQAGAAWIEAISNLDGSTLWKSASLASLAGWGKPPDTSLEPVRDPQGRVVPNRVDQINTPLDGLVRGEDLLFSLSEQAIGICDRRGRCAAFNLVDGTLLWSGQMPVSAVYDLEVMGDRGAPPTIPGRLLMVGAVGQAAETRATAICIDIASGREVWRIDPTLLGRHARFARFLDDGDVIVATSDGLLRVKGTDGRIAWTNVTLGVREAMGAWVVPSATKDMQDDAIFVLNGDFQLWRVNASDGTMEQSPVPTQDRVFLPFSAAVVDDRLILSSSAGVAMVSASGKLVGADAVDSPGQLEPGVVCEGQVLVLEAGDREQLDTGEVMNATRVLRFETGSARLVGKDRLVLFEAPDTIGVLDNRLLVGQGPFTLVYSLSGSQTGSQTGSVTGKANTPK